MLILERADIDPPTHLVTDAQEDVLIAELEEVGAGAVFSWGGPRQVRVLVERVQRRPVHQVGRPQRVERILAVFEAVAAQKAVVRVSLQPEVGIPYSVGPVSGLAGPGDRDNRVALVLLPVNQLIVLGRGDADAGIDPEPAEHGNAFLVDEGVAAEDAHIRVAGIGNDGGGKKRPVHQVGADGMSPRMAAVWAIRILVNVHKVVLALPVDAAVGIIRAAEALFRKGRDMIGRPIFLVAGPGWLDPLAREQKASVQVQPAAGNRGLADQAAGGECFHPVGGRAILECPPRQRPGTISLVRPEPGQRGGVERLRIDPGVFDLTQKGRAAENLPVPQTQEYDAPLTEAHGLGLHLVMSVRAGITIERDFTSAISDGDLNKLVGILLLGGPACLVL